jgi:hypothetical protein
MDTRRLRRVVSLTTVAATAVLGVVVGLNPFPDATQETATSAVRPDAQAPLAAREARATARLQLAERSLRTAAAKADSSVSVPPAPIVAVAPAPVAPVTQSSSS